MSAEILQKIIICGVATVVFIVAKVLIMRSVEKDFYKVEADYDIAEDTRVCGEQTLCKKSGQ